MVSTQIKTGIAEIDSFLVPKLPLGDASGEAPASRREAETRSGSFAKGVLKRELGNQVSANSVGPVLENQPELRNRRSEIDGVGHDSFQRILGR